MKQIKTIMLLLIATIAFTAAKAQDTKTDTFKVWGNCGMCKKTIEKAAKTEGVEKAEWNRETKVFTLVYNPAVVSNEKVQKSIAAAGYDTEKFTGDDKAYEKLPGCCQYERKKKDSQPQQN
ncbi:heavy-metal-associated domain-containing protein [Sediminibacterium sp.]|uniref:heavy-metal-associated domain-containing protein n=1 Tax=Sediminibacterium sp. TaxID=1917865 RepID=UPI0025FE4C95|nr:heavy-metal-associated domain-containing protein [Sediminibacterium sp.]MDP3393357.1 heavy-metal-associated domain-containing protein [Sediminibacterium sp.]MDP3567959.1 heavy-metal-associated domain-containing protein [Sediminibacterium sp.]